MVNGRFQTRYNGEISFEVEHIRLLEEARGQLLEGVTLILDPAEISPTLVKVLQEHQKSTGSGKGFFNVQLYDPQIGRAVKLVSGVSIPLNRNLMNIIDSYSLRYEFKRNQAFTGATRYDDLREENAEASEEMVEVESD